MMPPMPAEMALTQELVALVERIEPDPGPLPGIADPTEDEYLSLANALLAAHRPAPLWLFAYGSLIWKPEVEHVAHLPATVHGWHRRFCMRITRWRGTLEVPGLMMALDRGGSCAGVAYRLPDDNHQDQILRLLKRELDGNPATNVPRWVDVVTPEGTVKALTFVAAPRGPRYAGRLPLPEVARTLARAAGHWGSTAAYLYNTVLGLEEHGIRDRNLWALQALVAEEIRRLGGAKAA